ncbi:MAG: deoxyribose-phosphate aldolase [Elusimicrobiales bacterium]
MTLPDAAGLAGIIDHTLLKASATPADIEKLAAEALQHRFASVCVNPCHAALCARLLKNSPVKVCVVIGFPLGANTSAVKAEEARSAAADGADELDMVINIGALRSGGDGLVQSDIEAVRRAVPGKILKVIIETAYLTDAEKTRACLLAKRAGADFVKTSTGFAPSGATAADIALMRAAVGPDMGVKASGGIKDAAFALALVKAGATRLGTSSGAAIVSGREGGAY